MLRSAGLWRALLHRSRSDWPVVLAAGLLLLCATVLLAAGAVYGDVVALGGLRQAILDAPPANRVVVIGSSAAPADVNAIDDVVTSEAKEVFGSAGGEVGLVATSSGLAPQGADPIRPGRARPGRELPRHRGPRGARRRRVAGRRLDSRSRPRCPRARRPHSA